MKDEPDTIQLQVTIEMLQASIAELRKMFDREQAIKEFWRACATLRSAWLNYDYIILSHAHPDKVREARLHVDREAIEVDRAKVQCEKLGICILGVARMSTSRKSGFTSEFVSLANSQRKLVTIRENDPMWDNSSPTIAKDTIVRLFPPESASDAKVDAFLRALKEQGAIVRLMPKPSTRVIAHSPEVKTKESVRDVVLGLVGQTKARDLDTLRVSVETLLDEVGL